LDLALEAFLNDDAQMASRVEPLEQVIGYLKEQLRTRHILRLQQGDCTMDAGFVWSDLLTSLERTSGHCSNIAGCVMGLSRHDMNLHGSLRDLRNGSEEYRRKYTLSQVGYAET
jgi:phosphate:Na+ symporter